MAVIKIFLSKETCYLFRNGSLPYEKTSDKFCKRYNQERKNVYNLTHQRSKLFLFEVNKVKNIDKIHFLQKIQKEMFILFLHFAKQIDYSAMIAILNLNSYRKKNSANSCSVNSFL